MTLKFLGFSLSSIKNLLGGKLSVAAIFKIRKKFILEKIKHDKISSKILENIETVIEKIPLQNLLKVIMAYHVLHQVENKSISDNLNKKATTLYYRLTMILQNIPSEPTEEFLTSIEKISAEIELLVSGRKHK